MSSAKANNILWVIGILFWSAVIALFGWNELRHHREVLLKLASIEAQASFNKDLVYRRWAAGHGGVYVPVTQDTPPNEHLKHVPERDIETPSGRKLTLINPAYMTRQVHELAAKQYGVKGHITSLNPLRRENTPDEWEANALREFESGKTKVESIDEKDGEPHLRMMFPMTTEARCLKCHAGQGYAIGEIRGGMSVSVPLKPYLEIYGRSRPKQVIYHGFIWLLGLLGLLLARLKINKGIYLVEDALEKSRQIQHSLIESEERFQKFFRDNQAVMLLLNPQTMAVEDANHAACNYYGYSLEQFSHLKITDINTLSLDDVAAEIAKVKDGNNNYFVFQHRLSSGEIRDVEVYASPIVVKQKKYVFSIIHDITERKKLMEEQSRSAQLAALGTVAAGVAHEINNPINGIINYAHLLKTKPGDADRVQDFSQRISYESERIAKITKDLLHYSKDNREEMKPVDSKELIESALSLIVPKIRPSGITVETDLTEDAPTLVVNPQSIQQIIINLVDNSYDALRYKEVGKEQKIIKVKSSLITKDGQQQLCIEVSDNGIGMSADVVKNAKNAFFSTKPSTEGTGLGLSIVNEIIARHNGEFHIESCEGEYSKLTVCLPMQQPAS